MSNEASPATTSPHPGYPHPLGEDAGGHPPLLHTPGWGEWAMNNALPLGLGGAGLLALHHYLTSRPREEDEEKYGLAKLADDLLSGMRPARGDYRQWADVVKHGPKAPAKWPMAPALADPGNHPPLLYENGGSNQIAQDSVTGKRWPMAANHFGDLNSPWKHQPQSPLRPHSPAADPLFPANGTVVPAKTELQALKGPCRCSGARPSPTSTRPAASGVGLAGTQAAAGSGRRMDRSEPLAGRSDRRGWPAGPHASPPVARR